MSNKEWNEVMALATRYGFVFQSAGGTAILISHDEQKKLWGEEEFQRIQEMNKGKEQNQ